MLKFPVSDYQKDLLVWSVTNSKIPICPLAILCVNNFMLQTLQSFETTLCALLYIALNS